jgi:hypothetical protein
VDSQTVILLCSAIGAAQVIALAVIAYFQAVKVETVRRDLKDTGTSVSGKLDEIHHTFNSKMDAMLELTRVAAFAAGQKAEKDSHGSGSN